MLKNGNFEADWNEEKSHAALVIPAEGDPYEAEYGNIFTPPHWMTWFRHEEGGWAQPEVRDAHDARRVHSGTKATLLFTFGRKHDAGFLQQVQVEPGTRLRLTAWAHAWSNHRDPNGDFPHPDDPKWSEGVGYNEVSIPADEVPPLNGEAQNDAIGNFKFALGIDPTGGTNPLAPTVEWGEAACVYNGFYSLGCIATAGEGGKVTVFLRSRTLWPFKHNDAYWDDVILSDEKGTHSKLGPHILRMTEDGATYLAQNLPVVKFVGDWGIAESVWEGALVIGRRHCDYDAQSQRAAGFSPQEAAEKFIEDQLETYENNPAITYWEGHNEPVWNNEEEMDWFAQFEIARMELMADLGLKCVIGNFATGTPPLELWPAFLPATNAAKQYKAILGLHEYSCPWMWWMTGKYQIDPGEDQGDEGWGTLRYRKVYRQFPIGIPLVITECGIDPLVSPQPPDAESGTWKQLGDFWAEHDDEPDKADYYFRQLVWYDEELQKDDYVIGAAVFTWGNYGSPWNDYDVAETDVAKKLIAYVEANPAKPFVYASNRGEPRIQYERTYVLLPPDAGVDWYKAVGDATWNEHRYTIGSSADDAGIGNLDTRRVIAVNPGNWPGDLEAFFETFYPGIEYIPIVAASPDALFTRTLLCQCKQPWADEKLAGSDCSSTICQNGCWVCDCAMAQLHYGIDPEATPSTVNQALGPDGFSGCDCSHSAMKSKLGLEVVKKSWDEAEAIEWLTHDVCFAEVLPTSLQHFVFVTRCVQGRFWMYDPWKCHVGWLDETYEGVESWRLIRPVNQIESFTLRGLHDEGWLELDEGWCVIPAYLGTEPRQFDLSKYPKIRVLINLRYSYAVDDGGQGTMPAPDKLSAFEDACIETVKLNPDAWGFIYCNEMNNSREWPEGFELTPDYYIESYNRIWLETPDAARIIPGAIDPCNPGWGDWRGTWRYVLDNIMGCSALTFHAYTHGPDPALITGGRIFSDPPLEGVFYDMRMLESQQAIIPGRFANKPQLVTETNHLTKEDGSWGWEPEATLWVSEAYKYFKERGIVGACLFRYNYDQWNLNDKPLLLEALKSV